MKKNFIYMEDLVGRRYSNLELLKHDIELLSKCKVVNIVLSESERNKDLDFMIDYEYEDDCEVYTLFYLLDNANNYYITEV